MFSGFIEIEHQFDYEIVFKTFTSRSENISFLVELQSHKTCNFTSNIPRYRIFLGVF